jgi:hypothetical protein
MRRKEYRSANARAKPKIATENLGQTRKKVRAILRPKLKRSHRLAVIVPERSAVFVR